SNELLAHCYSHLYNIPATGLRFVTVYGPAGRPDMAYFKFTNKLLRGEDIQIFNFGNCARDFTFVADIVEALCRVIDSPPKNSPPHKVYNLGRGEPVNLLEFFTILQEELVRAGVLPADYDFDAHKKLVPAQPGDVPITFADTRDFERDFNFRPRTDLRTGLRSFASWYKNFYANN
ncbi:MAG: NAD-dependent epimerase/dehydratase family protein, partial [Selenomonadaceae bacterium]|nr:NAD-dependent epimerase/dehydratase family protein [Selenomonadaceae bacterium]